MSGWEVGMVGRRQERWERLVGASGDWRAEGKRSGGGSSGLWEREERLGEQRGRGGEVGVGGGGEVGRQE